MRLLAIFLLALASVCVQGYVIAPTGRPSRSEPTSLAANPADQAKPTTPPNMNHVLRKRTLQQTLSLYDQWHSICDGGNGNNNDIQQADATFNPSINMLWQTVTTTVNCGNGNVKTMTTTVTSVATATETVYSGPVTYECTGQCWSDYLWYTYGDGISVAQAFTGIVLMIIALYFAIFGYRFFRPTLALIGFIFFAEMTWIGLANNEPQFGYTNAAIIYICVSMGIGVIGAILFAFMHAFFLYFIGVVAGIFFAIFLMSWKESLVIQVQVARICFTVGMGVVWGGTIYLLELYSVIVATSFIGAYLFIMGLDFFAHTAFVNSWRFFLDTNKYHYNAYVINMQTYIMLAFVIVLTLISIGWQYYWNIMKLNRRFGVNVIPQPPPPPPEK
ncbi:hypothetical protein DM01DRAFT_1338340 [Hesseltinella vesiculosa]|uniref:Transmembrane protein 198 n=1 Tax=Hesseltinella vesiculosa TaxID=101127 RepID=A0A1X2GAI2_9FUNG|nr:hypothetical protein DM01DRAFT_1338340 [Hesseltinella vesiculosa]